MDDQISIKTSLSNVDTESKLLLLQQFNVTGLNHLLKWKKIHYNENKNKKTSHLDSRSSVLVWF